MRIKMARHLETREEWDRRHHCAQTDIEQLAWDLNVEAAASEATYEKVLNMWKEEEKAWCKEREFLYKENEDLKKILKDLYNACMSLSSAGMRIDSRQKDLIWESFDNAMQAVYQKLYER